MSRFCGKFWTALGVVSVLVFGVQAAAASADPGDFAAPGKAFNVLPPGQSGTIPPGPHSTDQIALYDGLTPLQANVTAADLPHFFKENVFGLGSLSSIGVESTPDRPDLVVTRDSFNVPHIEAPTRADVMYGVGWVTAKDRGLLMDVFKGPGRIAALSVPGLNAFQLAQTAQNVFPTQQTEDFLAAQKDVVLSMPGGQQIIDDIDNYLAGINGYRATFGGTPWTRNDVIATASLVGSVFGKGGGDEARRSKLLSALKNRLGDREGEQVWNDLRELNDPETSVSIDGNFRQQSHKAPNRKGNMIIDDDSMDAASLQNSAVAQESQQSASNALLVGADKSVSGNPLFVAGPQVGYLYPQVLMEIDVHGGGIDARGAVFPGSGPYVEIGRGKDYSWSATSAGNDIIDIFVEELCGDDTHYSFNGECREMTTFDVGNVGFGNGTPRSFKETVHGPVIGYATVDGERVALSSARTTRGREVVSAFGFADLNANVPTDADSFFDVASKVEFTFNWFYADKDEIAMYSSGRLPIRHPQVDIGLPTNGTGRYEWRGFLAENKHPHGKTPADGSILNWNNKPAKNWQAADDQWGYGSVHRNNLLERTTDGQQMVSLPSLVGAMNAAATQDLRSVVALRGVLGVLDTGPAPNPRVAHMVELLKDWRAAGSHRLDLDNNLTIDHPAAAILDKAWGLIGDAVLGPVMGPQLDDLVSLTSRSNQPTSQGSAFQSGWYGYVDKDLRTLLGRPVGGKFRTHFCGHGDLAACRDSLYAALDQAGFLLEDDFADPDPDHWRADASAERIQFFPGFLAQTMRWTNRPTFQQAISYSSHR
jgi:penicillin amidase